MSIKQRHEPIGKMALQTLVLLETIDSPHALELILQITTGLEKATFAVAAYDLANEHATRAQAEAAIALSALRLMTRAMVAAAGVMGNESARHVMAAAGDDWFGMAQRLSEVLKGQTPTTSLSDSLDFIRGKAETANAVALKSKLRLSKALAEMTQRVLRLESSLYAARPLLAEFRLKVPISKRKYVRKVSAQSVHLEGPAANENSVAPNDVVPAADTIGERS
jgi:hypothetical protein